MNERSEVAVAKADASEGVEGLAEEGAEGVARGGGDEDGGTGVELAEAADDEGEEEGLAGAGGARDEDGAAGATASRICCCRSVRGGLGLAFRRNAEEWDEERWRCCWC